MGKVVVSGEGNYGSKYTEAKFGLVNELNVGLGIDLGVKFGAEATFNEKIILSIVFCVVMPLFIFIFYKIVSLFFKKSHPSKKY